MDAVDGRGAVVVDVAVRFMDAVDGGGAVVVVAVLILVLLLFYCR